MVNIKGLLRSNRHLETNADNCNLNGIIEHIRIVSKHLGQLEQKRSDRTLKIQESNILIHENERLSNSINKIRLNCIASKK